LVAIFQDLFDIDLNIDKPRFLYKILDVKLCSKFKMNSCSVVAEDILFYFTRYIAGFRGHCIMFNSEITIYNNKSE